MRDEDSSGDEILDPDEILGADEILGGMRRKWEWGPPALLPGCHFGSSSAA